MRQNIRRDSAAGVADADFDVLGGREFARRNGDATTIGRRLGRIDQKIHQHL